MTTSNYRIETVYTLQQPLSHIGESESTMTFLNTIRIMTEQGPAEVFAYTGNAIRGQWRDSGAVYLLDKLGIKVPKKTFHLLFSGGNISGDQGIDVNAAKSMRSFLPFLSLMGGGVGSQILAGKINQTFAYPVCAETKNIIPRSIKGIDYAAEQHSWKHLTGEIQFSRKDDSKDLIADEYLALEDNKQPLLEIDSNEPSTKKKDRKDGPATQMRYAVEYMIPGVQLWHRIDLRCTELELGALVSCIHEWAKRPVLGGLAGKGFGLVDSCFEIVESDRTRRDFITISQGAMVLSPEAEESKEKYDAHLRYIYDQYLLAHQDQFIAMLESGGK